MCQLNMSLKNVGMSIGFVLVTTALVIVSGGNIGAALAPVIGLVALVALVSFPLRYTVTFFFSLVVLIHDPFGIPHEDKWDGPLSLLSNILYINLRQHTGIGALKFNLVELTLILLLIIVAIRTLLGNNVDRHLDLPAARPMKVAAFASLLGMVIAITWGVVHGGGTFSELLWQVRIRFLVPFILIVCMRAFKTESDFRRLGIALAVVCTLRVIEGAYFYHVIAMPQGVTPTFVMTHSDTVWLIALVVMLISSWLETMSRRALVRLLTLGGFIMYGVLINDRRIAYVSLAFSLLTMTVFIRNEVRRWLIRIIIVALPVLILYVVVGMHSQSAFFAPVQNLVSVSDNTDLSNWSRNCENYDLISTLATNPVLGVGWGHEYKAFKTQMNFTEFSTLHHPHNSLLGLLAFSGAIGFYLIWIYLPVGIFLASRSYYLALNSTQRTTAMVTICLVIIYMDQAYGDMGAKDLRSAIVLSCALACTANLAERLGAMKSTRVDS